MTKRTNRRTKRSNREKAGQSESKHLKKQYYTDAVVPGEADNEVRQFSTSSLSRLEQVPTPSEAITAPV